jgi:histidyl-tRNA synthetase
MIQALRGFRDFYPENQSNITYLQTKIADVCSLFGYEQFEGPAIESFDLYAAKSSDEIVSEQAFTFQDRGGEQITLRPELTPTLARMVANKQEQLIFPLRWWSFGRFWRYERPQRGRGREFYQWNCDLVGDDSQYADLEILEIVITFLQSLGLTQEDCVIQVSDRGFVANLLRQAGLGEQKLPMVFRFLDKLPKINSEEQADFAQKLGLSTDDVQIVIRLMDDPSIWESNTELTGLIHLLKQKKLDGWIEPSLSLVRGFTYYTGLVFEVNDRNKEFRALLGGGRYNNLVESVGGKPVSGIGFGMGDMVLLEYLVSKDLIPAYETGIDVCLISLGESVASYCQAIATELRQADICVVWHASGDSPAKGLKFANQKQIPYAIIIGENELSDQTITFKNLTSGQQDTLPRDAILTVLERQKNNDE